MWWIIALLGLAHTVWVTLTWELRDIDMSCSKIGEHSTGQPCDSTLVSAFGPWPLLLPGFAFVLPALLAAQSHRPRVSWLAVAWLTLLFLVGIGLWASLFSLLLTAGPLAILGLVATAFQQRAYKKNRN